MLQSFLQTVLFSKGKKCVSGHLKHNLTGKQCHLQSWENKSGWLLAWRSRSYALLAESTVSLQSTTLRPLEQIILCFRTLGASAPWQRKWEKCGWIGLINSILIYVGKAMRDKVPRHNGNIPMEAGIYANICKNQAGKRTLLGILIGLGFTLFCKSRTDTWVKNWRKHRIQCLPPTPDAQFHFPGSTTSF